MQALARSAPLVRASRALALAATLSLLPAASTACSRGSSSPPVTIAATPAASSSASSDAKAPSASNTAPASAAKHSALAPPSAEKLETARARLAAIEAAKPEERPGLAADALFELERDRLPLQVLKALGAAAKPGLDAYERAQFFALALSDPSAEWDETCPDPGAYAEMVSARTGMERKSAILFERCKLGRHGLVDAAEGPRWTGFSLAMGFACFAYVERRGSVVEPERALLLALMREPNPPRRAPPPR